MCAVTHVLISDVSLLRRRDGVDVIGVALAASSTGCGHRRVALLVGVPVSTVRGWLRRFAVNSEMVRGLVHGVGP